VCGILGVGGPRGAEWVERLLGGLAHRGPDDEGRWSSPELSLGHRRLAIIGLDAGGRQPMTSRSGESVIAFNGEIYNYLELADRLEAAGRAPDRRYDTAVLVEALELWGREVLPQLNGMFAFAWYRPAARRLLLARDRFGKKPLFWGTPRGETGAACSCSRRAAQLHARPGRPPPPDPLGVARYLVYDGCRHQSTVYRDLSQVPAPSWVDSIPTARRGPGGWRYAPRPNRSTPTCARYGRSGALAALRLRATCRSACSCRANRQLAARRSLAPDPARRAIRTFTVGFEDGYDERGAPACRADRIRAP
jgi:asparagine synthase (glutamine-hydrolysing)